jgi:hypothetical protein
LCRLPAAAAQHRAWAASRRDACILIVFDLMLQRDRVAQGYRAMNDRRAIKTLHVP